MGLLPELLTVAEWATLLVSFVMMGSGMPICLKMYRNKSTANVPYILFLISIFLSSLGLQYGIMINNWTLMLINSVSVVVWGVYTLVYILVSESKSSPIRLLLAAVALYLAHLAYLSTVPSHLHTPTFGKYMLVWSLLINVIPSADIFTILKEKSTKCCDLSLLTGGSLCAATWFFYGYLLGDVNIFFPSVIGLTISGVKFGLIFLYGLPSRDSAEQKPSIDKKIHTNVQNGSRRVTAKGGNNKKEK